MAIYEIGAAPFEVGSLSAALAMAHNKGVRYSTVIDVGSADGSFFLGFLRSGIFAGATPVNIDANPIYEESLRAIRDAAGGHYVIGAASDADGETEMTLGTHPYWSSLLGKDDQYWKQIPHQGTRKVSTFTIDGLSDRLVLKPPYLLKLDVQGVEAQVLRGARRILQQTEMVICESGIDDFQTINGMLIDAGFDLFDMTELHRMDDRSLGWFYPVYLNRRLRTIKDTTPWSSNRLDEIIQLQEQRRAWLLQFNASTLAEMRCKTLNLHLSNGVTLVVPRSLQAITTYVLLEQETWFEKELAFLSHVLQPGMTAIDVGANLGIYSLTMARAVAPGQVFAYEPANEPRALLKQNRELNRATNLEICRSALSDSHREGHLAFGTSSEPNALAESAPGERVQITTLDMEEAERGWPAPDFVKIDAEGEGERIIAGGADFFVRHSPLVMLGIKLGDVIDKRLLPIFPSLGYRLYRVLPATPILIPVDPEEASIDNELNLFAAKPDRARVLAQAGLLVEAVPEWQPDAHARSEFLTLWRAQAFAPIVTKMLQDLAALDPDYRDALGAYAVWRTLEKPLPERYAALSYAFRVLRPLCQRAANSARLSTFARVAFEAGERVACAEALRTLTSDLQRGSLQVSEPFWPASPRFDTVAADGRAGEWFLTSVVEQHEKTLAVSSKSSGGSPGLGWLCQQPLASTEMHRRRMLLAAAAGHCVKVPPRLRTAAPDHLNAEVWRTGQVPGTSTSA